MTENIIGTTAYSSGHFGRGGGPIALSNLLCSGLEGRLVDCPSVEIGVACSHSEDAGVRCQACTGT